LTLEGGAFVDDGGPTRVEGAPAGAWAAAGIARDHQGRFAVGFATPVRDDIREVTVLFLREDRSVESLSRQLIEQPRESKVLPIGALDDGRAVIADGDALTFHHRDGLAPTEPVSIEPPPGNVVGPKLLGGLAILEGDVMILNDDRNGRLRRVELTGALVPNDVDPLTTVFDANIEAVPFPDPPAGRTTTRALTVAPDGLVVFTDNADRVMLIGQSCE
jgi:hypothetical protein